jgi:hypothetical protein
MHLGDILNGRGDRPSVLYYRHVECFHISKQGSRNSLPRLFLYNPPSVCLNLINLYSFNPLSMYVTQAIYLSTSLSLFLPICRPSFLSWNILSFHSLSFLSANICQAIFVLLYSYKPVPVAAPSKAWVYNCSFSENAGSNPDRGMNVCLLWALCGVR